MVSTRVCPAMFPPTMSAAPTSEMTAPKPAMPAASSGSRASIATAHSERTRPAPERLHLQPELRVDVLQRRGESPATSGSAIAVWAMTIAVGV